MINIVTVEWVLLALQVQGMTEIEGQQNASGTRGLRWMTYALNSHYINTVVGERWTELGNPYFSLERK